MSISRDSDALKSLAIALTETQDLVRSHDEQSRTIERLRHENQCLREEIESLRSDKEQTKKNTALHAQFEDMFKNDIEKQAQIDELKRELKSLRSVKACPRRNLPIASPTVSFEGSDGGMSPSLQKPFGHGVFSNSSRPRTVSPRVSNTVAADAIPHKRQRTASPGSRLSLRHTFEKKKPTPKRCSNDSFLKEAISAFSEGGEEQDERDTIHTRDIKLAAEQTAEPYHRLGSLLSAPSSKNPLLKPDQTGTEPVVAASPSHSPQPPVQRGLSDTVSTRSAERGRPKFLPPKRRIIPGPEDNEPLRARPVSRLNLSHFKLNPRTNEGYDYAFGQTVRNDNDRRCLPGCMRDCCGNKFMALAAAFRAESGMSDNDILLEFLGAGSEEKIRSLTTPARENLLHEAYAQKIANRWGKHRNVHDRPPSPVDFWEAEMPDSQKEKDAREQAWQRERAEVERRQMEACKEGGKWIYADE